MQKKQKISMKELPVSERPYEKCEQYGAEFLSDAELLAVIIQTGSGQETAVDLARRVLCATPDQGLAGLAGMTLSSLQQINGIGRVKAIKLLCVYELTKRIAKASFRERIVFDEPSTIADYCMQSMRFLKVEQVRVMYFNSRCICLGEKTLTVGTVNSSLISPREIFIEAIKVEAVNLILVHNHPSGDPSASEEDISVTRRVAEAGKMLDIKLLDHIIIGDNSFVSLREMGYF